jgi:hypothetical protein
MRRTGARGADNKTKTDRLVMEQNKLIHFYIRPHSVFSSFASPASSASFRSLDV